MGLTGNGSGCLILCCNIIENRENLFLKNLCLISGTKFFKGRGYSDLGCPFTVLLCPRLDSVELVVVSILLSSLNSA